MKKLERWAYSLVSNATSTEDLARYAAANDLIGGAALLGGPSEVRSEWEEFFAGDRIVELTDEEWAVFVREYEAHLGRGL